MVEQIEKLREVVAIATSPGNWDANEYMLGMANGLILALHIMEDAKDDPPYLRAPKCYLDSLPPVTDAEPVKSEPYNVETRSL